MALCLSAASARGIAVVKRDFADLVARAEQIVVGTVIRISPGEAANGAPLTLVTFADLSVLKGSAGSTLTLELYGGSQGDVATRIPELPQFKEGERAVLFVAGNGRDVCPLVGVWQGRFRVRFDAERGTDIVEADDGRAVVGRSGRALRYALPGARSTNAALTLDDFHQLVSDELARPAVDDGN